MRFLGIDYGLKKVGLAVSEGEMASALKVLHTNSLADALQKISKVIKDEQIEKVIIGVAESGESKKITTRFIGELKKRMGSEIEIIEAKETLSTLNAQDLMLHLDISKEKEDAYAAQMILQEYLDHADE